MFCARCGAETPGDPCSGCGEDPKLGGRWTLLEVFARGAMGVTWRASGPDGRHVAVKEIAVSAGVGVRGLEQAHREADVLRQLDHRAVPDFIDEIVEGTGRTRAVYLVQELVEGTDLAEELRNRRYTEDEVIAILDELCGVLGYLHGLSPPVIHRDIKPANVRRRPDGSLVLVDFGSVRDALGDPPLGGDVVEGTFGYMAPEQFAGEASERSDIYALGALAVALLTRQDPATLQRHDRSLRWRPHAAVSAPVAAAVDKLLSLRPSDRPASVKEVRALLKEAREARDRPRGIPIVVKVAALMLVVAVLGANLVGLVGILGGLYLWQPQVPDLSRGPAPERPAPEQPAPSPAPTPPPAPTPAPPTPPAAPAPSRPDPGPRGRAGQVQIVWRGKSGAELFIDGESVGRLPVRTRLRSGQHEFAVRDGPVEMATTIDVRIDPKHPTRIDLQEHW